MARKVLKDGDVPVADGEQFDYDLFVIGAGSGGVRGSRTAASFGAKVPYSIIPRPRRFFLFYFFLCSSP
jgi:glutathione reductase (NADPH)